MDGVLTVLRDRLKEFSGFPTVVIDLSGDTSFCLGLYTPASNLPCHLFTQFRPAPEVRSSVRVKTLSENSVNADSHLLMRSRFEPVEKTTEDQKRREKESKQKSSQAESSR